MAVLALAPAAAEASTIGGCPLFPRSNPWNQRVDKLPLVGNSKAIVNSIGADENLFPDFGSGLYQGRPIGIPFVTVPRGQPKVPMSFDYADESDRGPYPIPPDAPIEGGPNGDGDRHVIVVQRGACKLWETFDSRPQAGGSRWTAGSGATWSLRSNRLRPHGWTSADAAGLPILPGLARYDEVKRGDRIGGFPKQARVVLTALKRYGMILADNGSDWFVSGAPSPGWNNDQLRTLRRVPGSAFEVVRFSRR